MARERSATQPLTGRRPAEPLVDTLLAPLAPEVVRFQRDRLGLSVAEVAEGLAELARAVLGDAHAYRGPGA